MKDTGTPLHVQAPELAIDADSLGLAENQCVFSCSNS